MYDDWEDLDVDEDSDEEEREEGRGGNTVGHGNPSGSGNLEAIVPLRDLDSAINSGGKEGSGERGSKGFASELVRSSPIAPRASQRAAEEEEEEVLIEEVEGRGGGYGAAATPRSPQQEKGLGLVLLPGPIGQLQRALSRKRARSGGPGLMQNDGSARRGVVSARGSKGQREERLSLMRGMEDEEDFKSKQWLLAMSALDVTGPDAPAGSAPAAAVVDIKDIRERGLSSRKVSRVVGLVKHVDLGGDGNAYVVLKDPSGSIGATVHSEVLSNPISKEGEISVGSVLVLEKVSTFSPDDRAQFLCVTLDNILQVFA
ncbi:hypothetical protein A3770_12p66860 [Chloropicon primus]|uniref:Homologous recombination OB-fold protein OB-fold domain-containing protein n=2 Tax=Chloropicon primus TaxID=1764295 RepID=A0A5B8MTQ4_9CHLO|nr:hypothetical protein A3770_12p66860 [Chloropicon primus]|eukprot:QDZ24168.1 hypothetical protein A3770_12p66860 [Chloropicon primus]